MKEWEKHLGRAEEKLRSANILFENIEELYAKSLAKAETRREKADYDIYYEPSDEEAESILEDAENFLERIKRAVKELK